MKKILLTTTMIGLSSAAPIAAATLISDTDDTVGWNTSNVLVGTNPPDGETGESVVYDKWPIGTTVPDGAETNGKIVFVPPEATSPGIEVLNPDGGYEDSNPLNPDDPLQLTGCIKTSSNAACDDGFQSGKRIKQQMTDTGPMDLVFNLDPTDLDTVATYQVFGRLINKTDGDLDGFKLELGYGVGDTFVNASVGGPLTFSTEFTAQPGSSTNVTTQYPFGLFGAASDSPNFVLDGFFDDERTGLLITQNATEGATTITSAEYYGGYNDIFGDWLSSKVDPGTEPLPEGIFWDFDADPDTDNLLMAWQLEDGSWEVRRTIGETCGPTSGSKPDLCSPGVTLEKFLPFATRELAEAYLTDEFAKLIFDDLSDGTLITAKTAIYSGGPIEDLANLNLNYAILLGDMSDPLLKPFSTFLKFDKMQPTFTLRTTVFAANEPAPVPLPAGGPLLLVGLAMIGFLRKRRFAA